MNAPVFLDGKSFRSRHAAIDYVRGVLSDFYKAAAVDGRAAISRHRHPGTLLHELVERHPKAATKIGDAGIESFRVEPNPMGNGLHVTLVRFDGTAEDVSWQKFDKGHDEAFVKRRYAYRHAILPDVLAAKDAFRDGDTCQRCGSPVFGATASDVDHLPPWTFAKIVEAFEENKVGLPTEFADDPTYFYPVFRDQDFAWALAFRAFHAERAQMRVSHARCNRGAIR